MAAALVGLVGLCLEGADVQCIWNGNTYVCSGTGSSIEVIGGGSGGPVTVTNFWGVCTNCVAMSPEYCTELKSYLLGELSGLLVDMDSISSGVREQMEAIYTIQADISTFQHIGSSTSVGNQIHLAAYFRDLTNYVNSVENTQTQLDRSYIGTTTSGNSRLSCISYNDGIYDYAQQVDSQLSSITPRLSSLEDSATAASSRLRDVQINVEDMSCEACQPDYQSGGGSGIATNGNWCTFDQGEAIKSLLGDLKTWAERQHFQLVAISNYVEQSYNTMRDGFFTGYTHIPTEDDLGMKWQDLYLEGYSPNFHEYASTNILARIELLLAGMSGVLTNSSDFAEAGGFAENGMEATNKFEVVINDFTNEVRNVIQEREQNVRSVGDSLIGLYNAFRGWSGTPFSRTTLIGSYSFEIGENHWDVPSFEPSEKGLWVGNLIRVVCRSVMSVLYILFTVAVFIRFHIAFFQWVLKYLKWGIELMQGLFA